MNLLKEIGKHRKRQVDTCMTREGKDESTERDRQAEKETGRRMHDERENG